ncbi:glycosyltransferase [Dyella sp. BiH032]|uniref:glycosyltransferase n=1 Tax=Dyella sp. BiH032 TaxID=3075430 RepID=UPI00289300DF|nr:glycosyltransferase [Dyella sp. BiH032]WNL45591.1 glycosyltransferase [Dyella sp. BiH032]
MSKVNLFLFAAHHATGNVAAQRFKGLVKYLDADRYRVHVFAREQGAGTIVPSSPAVEVIPLPGHCVGSESSLASSLLSMASAFVRSLPFTVAGSGAAAGGPWLVNALAEADRRCRDRLAAGERCVAIGTYSPIDALIAAASLASRHGLPCIQDFRDGLVFEPLGRPGVAADAARRLIESRVIGAATMVTSVSPALVEDFARRYPGRRVGLLPNGFDPDDFAAPSETDAREAEELLAREIPPGVQLIGHFGRVGASDASASQSLERFVSLMNAIEDSRTKRHVLFVGELTERERHSLERARFGVACVKPVRRGLALQLMKRCDRLLLLTGNRVCCATGKVFEYLASGVPVVCVSGVENAASSILAETGAGQTLVTQGGGESAEALRRMLAAPPVDRRNIGAYSKVAQAGVLDRWIADMVAI